MNRVEVYIEDMNRFILELKRAKAERVFYMVQKTQQPVPTLDKAGTVTKSASNFTAVIILTAYVSDGEYALEARQTHQSLTISSTEDFDKFDKDIEQKVSELVQKLQEDCPKLEIFKGVLIVK